MDILELTYEEYEREVDVHYVFDKVEFNQLNSYKVDGVRYFLFKNNRKRFAICVGEKGGEWLCPFSAPFGMFEILRQPIEIEFLDEAISIFNERAKKEGIQAIHITLPPMFYDVSFISAIMNSLLRMDYKIKFQDINFQFDLRKVKNNYENYLTRNGRKNFHISQESGLKLIKCESIDDKSEAYEVIRINREQRGFPLRMSFDQVKDTIEIVGHDCFIVRHAEENIAAAIVFQVTDVIMQVVYWGDIPGHPELKAINFLAYKLICYYTERGISYLDIGPSTERGVPNIGLCNFKTSIGCDMSSKYSLVKEFK